MAPSAVKPTGGTYSADWQEVPFETPRALRADELPGIVEQFRTGAKNARAAGFDGVEVHCANGYLLHQFLEDGSNHRTDNYGGSIESRARLVLEVLDAVIAVWGKDRVGVRLSPYGPFNDMHDTDPLALYSYLLAQLSARGIAYVHMIEPRASDSGSGDGTVAGAPETAKIFRKHFTGVLISAGGYDRASALRVVADGTADAVAFGRLFIANPDLPQRLEQNAPLNRYDRSTFYGGAEKGYTDYAFLPEGRASGV